MISGDTLRLVYASLVVLNALMFGIRRRLHSMTAFDFAWEVFFYNADVGFVIRHWQEQRYARSFVMAVSVALRTWVHLDAWLWVDRDLRLETIAKMMGHHHH